MPEPHPRTRAPRTGPTPTAPQHRPPRRNFGGGLPTLLLLLTTLAFTGPAVATEITGKAISGYQGWFRTPDDGSDNGWFHYSGRGGFRPGNAGIELWPDVSELPEHARVDTAFRHADGSVAQVFSSVSPEVTDLHFDWMRDYGIDGVFIQRFAVIARREQTRRSLDSVLENCLRAARRTDRAWAVMYDLSGLGPGNANVIIEDWQRLQAAHDVGDPDAHPNHLRHEGRPLVALWGMGFSDRDPMWNDWLELINFFKDEQNCAVLLGVPTYWRELNRDAHADERLHEILRRADIVSPWTVGRYASPRAAAEHARTVAAADLAWCAQEELAFLPVAFPGFSWRNLMLSRGQDAEFNAIPRRGGRFFWSQARAYHEAGAKMLYVAMFDELDEGTAIMKWNNDPPVGESRFLTEPGIPNDHYLRLTGEAARLFRGETVEEHNGLPVRRNHATKEEPQP